MVAVVLLNDLPHRFDRAISLPCQVTRGFEHRPPARRRNVARLGDEIVACFVVDVREPPGAAHLARVLFQEVVNRPPGQSQPLTTAAL